MATFGPTVPRGEVRENYMADYVDTSLSGGGLSGGGLLAQGFFGDSTLLTGER